VRTNLLFGDAVVVNDPAAVRRVLQENEAETICGQQYAPTSMVSGESIPSIFSTFPILFHASAASQRVLFGCFTKRWRT
jgi:hypothetical protein